VPGKAKKDAPFVVAIVPARYASTRFPGKPLVDLRGRPMIAHVVERVAATPSVTRVVVATDDERIAAAARAPGVDVVMTAPELPSGTDRIAQALERMRLPRSPHLVLNVQGDEPLIDPDDLDALVVGTLRAGTPMGTLARPLVDLERARRPEVVKVVVGQEGRALYFSRALIPFDRDAVDRDAFEPAAPAAPDAPVRYPPALPWQHVGVYAFRPDALARFTKLAPTPLERTEKLEQLRAIEHGLAITIVPCVSEAPSLAIDVPDDVPAVLAALDALEAEDDPTDDDPTEDPSSEESHA
jgi:3-deoxy-manno-octulosonate cytidylyltransferase (CMP-KDO synthetase)